jgi:hypothetical protein
MNGSPFSAGLPAAFLAIPPVGDPFTVACLCEEMPGLLGQIDPSIWNRLATRFGKGPAEWGLEDWQKAARILGLMIDQIERNERLRKIADSTPKRRGPKPKLPMEWRGMGLLGWLDPPEPKKRGRPSQWTPERLEGVWGIAQRFRHELIEEGRRGTDKEVLNRMIETGYALAKRSNPRLAKYAFRSAKEGPWRNALIRAKKLFSK